MEKAYKMALEIILKMCIKENYSITKEIQLVCETALEKSEEKEDVCS